MRLSWVPISLAAALLFAVPVRATTIAWATAESSPGNLNAAGILGPPNTFVTTFPHDLAATFSAFSQEVDYSTAALAAAFDVSLAVLATVEFVAFEQNTNPIGFESSQWTFDDGTNSIFHQHPVGGGPAGPVIKNGNMTSATFNAIFGTSFAPSNTIGFLLFGVTQVPGESAVDASTMSVTLQGGPGVNATFNWPDAVAVGVLVPEPATTVLVAGSLLALGLRRRR